MQLEIENKRKQILDVSQKNEIQLKASFFLYFICVFFKHKKYMQIFEDIKVLWFANRRDKVNVGFSF